MNKKYLEDTDNLEIIIENNNKGTNKEEEIKKNIFIIIAIYFLNILMVKMKIYI